MKKIIFTLLVIQCSVIIANAQWVQMSNGMGVNKSVWSMTVFGNNILAGVENHPLGSGGVYRSTNNGESWSQTSLNNKTVWSFAVNGNSIYAGTSPGVFLSTNNGQNWLQIGLINKDVWALAINGSNIFAGTSVGVFISTNNGMNWAQTSLNNRFISSLVISENNIFAGDWQSCSVFRSSDNGSNWTPIPLGGSATEVVACLSINGNNFFAGTDNGGVFRSTNNGLNWTGTSLNNVSVNCLAINSGYIFAGAAIWSWSYGGVFLSSDNGNSWILKKQGMSNGSVWSLATSSQYVFAGTDSSVWRRDISEIIGINNISTEIPDKFSLSQNYPNPFNAETRIKFDVSSNVKSETSNDNPPFTKGGLGGFVSLRVFDIIGKEVAVLVNETLQPGSYEVTFDGSSFASGIYFYKLSTNNFVQTKKLILLK